MSKTRNVTHWAVGVTTAPRQQPTLSHCLASLADAGWTNPRLFAEPGMDIPAEYSKLPISCRDSVLGAFPNWYLGLAELFLREPRAHAYFICQDDVLFSVGLRDYLEETLWPAPVVGVVSVYCPSHYDSHELSGFHVDDRGWDAWGALAYIFSNPGVRTLLTDLHVLNHRHHGPSNGLRNIDSVVGAWCQRLALPYYVHVPSLTQHIGATSTLYPDVTNDGPRRARDFPELIADLAFIDTIRDLQ